MTPRIAWALLIVLGLLNALWHAQAQWNYQRLIQISRALELRVEETALEEMPQSLRVRFTLILTNSSDQTIPIEGVSCLLWAGEKSLGPCALPTEIAPSVSAGGEWRLEVVAEVRGHYWENYHQARSAPGFQGVLVRGSVQVRLPTGRGPLETTRRFHALIR
ncbi:MAG: hypothetical protein NZ610_06860 [Candidatus Bipolaricaulota bacterium]|nr:hypothetical protein [Candidatus Bipolaricaulota bacterium]MCS7275099.1 hypothetical protein [Candidatus Bipolaricaulota bacterium]MDW8110427.1 hypothetical protein [Candidatus Bipolaricaulota bacterium]MDW8329721.1 hypothetical protein [Candidatus Bipolaricaulota bacterium]